MDKIKTYAVDENIGDRIYMIDSNVLLAISQFYYLGEVRRSELTKEELCEFIKRSRIIGVDYNFPIVELCFDYKTNNVNAEKMNKIMYAFDNVVMNMTNEEIDKHQGVGRLKYNKLKSSYKYNTIFECNLPQILVENNEALLNLLYVMYLYYLKIYDLYYKKTTPLKKIEELFIFATEEVNQFLIFEFYLGVMLFIGTAEYYEIASKIYKPKENPNLQSVLNALIDIFQYRMAHFYKDMHMHLNMPKQILFSTCDVALQRYIELNESFLTVFSENNISPFGRVNVEIKEKYVNEWNVFYKQKYRPKLKERNFEHHLRRKTNEEKDKITRNIRQLILEYEKKVYKI